MVKCSFCAGKVPDGRGKMFVKTEGRIFYFCDSKCEKNFRMGRQGKDIRWTDSSAKERGKQA